MFSFLRKLTLPIAAVAAIELWVLMLYSGAERINAGSVPEASPAPAKSRNSPTITPPDEDDNLTIVGTETLSARQIAPRQFGYAAVRPGERLERIPARAPLSPPPDNAAKPEDGGLPRPNAIAAGIIGTADGPIRLWGIEPTDPRKRCQSGTDEWPCGMMARTAMRMFLRNRTVQCGDPIETVDSMPVMRCTLGRTDISQWLAEHGWAEATSGSPYKSAADHAREAGLGLYGGDARQ